MIPRFPVRRRALACAAGALVVGLALTGCDAGRAPAASVAGDEISADQLIDDLRAEAAVAAKNPAPDGSASALADPAGPTEGTFKADASAAALTNRIRGLLIGAELARRGVEVTEQDRESARNQLCAEPADPANPAEAPVAPADGSCPALDDYPAAYREFQLDLAARQGALQAALVAGQSDREERARALYEQLLQADPGQLEVVCFLPALVPDAAAGETLRGLVEGGQDFATAASSIEGAQAAPEEQCALVSGLPPDITEAAAGAVVGPLETQQGFFMILVGARRAATFEEVAEQLLAQVDQESQAAIGDELREIFGDVDVEVDPRYGRWDPETVAVEPPVPPRGPTTTVPVLPGTPAAP